MATLAARSWGFQCAMLASRSADHQSEAKEGILSSVTLQISNPTQQNSIGGHTYQSEITLSRMKSLCTSDSFPLCLYHADPEGSVYRNFFPLFLSQSTQHLDDCRPNEDFMKSIHVLIPDLYSQPSISEYRI